MSTLKPQEHKDPEVSIEQAIGRTELFIEMHGKKMLIALIVIILAVGGYFAYINMYSKPRAVKASAAMFDAQALFAQDSFAVALAGDGVALGFNDIMDEYNGTPQANLAAHYAGICCLRTGQFDKAIEYFDKFKSSDKGVDELLAAQNTGLIGDCYVEKGDMAKGIEYYIKAVSMSNNEATAPVFLQKAALVNLSSGNAAAAIEQFQAIKSQYPNSITARYIDKFIALAQQQQK